MRPIVSSVLLSSLGLPACVSPASPSTPSSPTSGIAPTDLGALSMPAPVTARDGAASAQIGGRVAWTFGDTLMTHVAEDGWQYRSSTAAWGTGASLSLDEALDANGTPLQLLPYTESESAYNRANGPTERYALWPASVLADSDGGALIVFLSLKVHPGALNYENLGVGLAHLGRGRTQASRDAALLFAAPDRAWSVGAVRDAQFTYLYACDPVKGVPDEECRVVRAPTSNATAAWSAWDGEQWNPDRSRAAVVLTGAPGDLSVSRNTYAGGYLAVYSGVFSNDVFFRTAPRPEGPWSLPHKLFTAQAPPGGATCYAAKEHPELASADGRTIVVSYARPLGDFRGEVRLTRVMLQ